MPSGTLTIREVFDDADLVACVDVVNRADTRNSAHVDRLRHFRATVPIRIDLIAREGDEHVGTAFADTVPGNPEADWIEAGIYVVPEARRAGVGDALYRELGRRLGGRYRELLVETKEDCTDALSFLDRRGFREVERESEVELDLSELDGPPAVKLPEGVRLVTRDVAGEAVERGMYEVAADAVRDIPGDEEHRVGTFEDWRIGDLDRPDRTADLCVVALFGDDEVIGYGILGRDSDEVAGHGLTAVRRSWRGKGVAGAIKRAQIGLAMQKGFSRMLTGNEVTNAPIRHLNERLGYKPKITTVFLRGPVP